MKMINSNLEIWMSYWPLKNVLVKLLEQLGFNLLMKTKLSILKKLRRKSSRLRIKKKQKNQFWMKMEMRSHKKEVMQSQRVTMLLKFHNLKLKNMNGLSPTENLKIYLNFSWNWNQTLPMKWNLRNSSALVSMKQFLNPLMNSAKELAQNQISRFTNKSYSLNDY